MKHCCRQPARPATSTAVATSPAFQRVMFAPASGPRPDAAQAPPAARMTRLRVVSADPVRKILSSLRAERWGRHTDELKSARDAATRVREGSARPTVDSFTFTAFGGWVPVNGVNESELG